MSDDAFWKDRIRDASSGRAAGSSEPACSVLCPVCGSATFIDSHTPASDHPELSTDRHQCEKCDWHSDEWPTPNNRISGFEAAHVCNPTP